MSKFQYRLTHRLFQEEDTEELEDWIIVNSHDAIGQFEGDVFYGTRSQFRDAFFDNANNDAISAWASDNNLSVSFYKKI